MGKKLWVSTENEHEESKHYDDHHEHRQAETFAESPAEMIEDADSSLEMTEKVVKTSLEQLYIVEGISAGLGAKKVCSEAYMVSLENYRPVVEQIIGKLGLSRTIPSTEDFLNEHRAKAAQQIATEGLGDFLKKGWEKLKEFFVLFFKKMMLLLKRLVKANLDLESYEKYVDSMMSKLRSKSSSVQPTDLAAFDSKLPVLLADEGMESMDAEYFMNYGVRKIDSLLGVMNRVGFKGLGRLNENDGLPLLTQKLHDFVVKHGTGEAQPIENLVNDATSLRQFSLELVTSIFAHNVNDPRELPETVYSSIHDAFDRAEMGSGFAIRSLEPHNAGKDSLPKDANIFMAYSANGSMLATGHISSNTHIRQMINPPSTFRALQGVYETYKNRVSKTNVQNADKTLDKTSDVILKLLAVLTKDFSKMVDNVKSSTSDPAELLVQAMKRGLSMAQIVQETFNVMFPDGPVDVMMDLDYGDVANRFMQMQIKDTSEFRTTFKNAYYEKLDALFQRYGSSMRGFADTLSIVLNGDNRMSAEDAQAAKEILQDLSRTITNVLTRLQSILRFIMTGIYGVYTEVRYEYIRYLYMSAQRFRVT